MPMPRYTVPPFYAREKSRSPSARRIYAPMRYPDMVVNEGPSKFNAPPLSWDTNICTVLPAANLYVRVPFIIARVAPDAVLFASGYNIAPPLMLILISLNAPPADAANPATAVHVYVPATGIVNIPLLRVYGKLTAPPPADNALKLAEVTVELGIDWFADSSARMLYTFWSMVSVDVTGPANAIAGGVTVLLTVTAPVLPIDTPGDVGKLPMYSVEVEEFIPGGVAIAIEAPVC